MKTGVLVILGLIVLWVWSRRQAEAAPEVPPLPPPPPLPLPPLLSRPSPCGSFGDIDGDGVVTEMDAKLVADYVVGGIILSSEQLLRADVNGDDSVDIIDAMFIDQYVKGLRDTFPICGVR